MRLTRRTVFLIQTPIIAVRNGKPVTLPLTVGVATTARQAGELCEDYQRQTGHIADWVETPVGIFDVDSTTDPYA